MAALVPILFWIVFIQVGLSALAMLLFGIRSMAYGKIKPITAVIVAVPILLLVVLGFALGDWALAGITSVIILLGVAALGLLVSGMRNAFG